MSEEQGPMQAATQPFRSMLRPTDPDSFVAIFEFVGK
jgi:hypothetical protein